MIGRLMAFAVGVAIGVLCAPRSGRATRQILMDKCDELCGAPGGDPGSFKNGRDRVDSGVDHTSPEDGTPEAGDPKEESLYDEPMA